MPKSVNIDKRKTKTKGQQSESNLDLKTKPNFKKTPSGTEVRSGHAGGRRNFDKSKIQQQKFNKSTKPYISKAAAKAAELEEQRKQAKLEKEQRVAQYKKKRLEKTKIISKRTSRGQPLMKDRMEYLLKQIQEMKRS